jgi:hypothetical protein
MTVKLANGASMVIYHEEDSKVSVRSGQNIYLRVNPEDVQAFGEKAY